MAPGDGPAWLPAGRVGRPHGLDGSFHVTRPRAALLKAGTELRVGDDVRTEVVRLAGTSDRPIVRLAATTSREQVEALRGTELWAPRSAAPPLEEDEYWAQDLEGCRVVDGDAVIGTVLRLSALPSCEVLEVQPAGAAAGAPELLIPLVRDAVREVDLDGRVIHVDSAFLGLGS